MQSQFRKQYRKRHEELRVPSNWRDQERALAIQLDRILDDIYAKIGSLEEKVKGLTEAEEEQTP